MMATSKQIIWRGDEPLQKGLSMKIYTSTNYSYNGPDKIDITVKSGDKVFAPSWGIVMGHKNKQITDKQYTDAYYEMMRKSFNENQRRWLEVAKMERVVFCCYCPPDGRFCHRYILVKMFLSLCKYFGIEATYEGEI